MKFVWTNAIEALKEMGKKKMLIRLKIVVKIKT